jgi:hypothetical protein
MKSEYPLKKEPVLKATSSFLINLMEYSRKNVRSEKDVEEIMKKLNLKDGAVLTLNNILKFAKDPQEQLREPTEPTAVAVPHATREDPTIIDKTPSEQTTITPSMIMDHPGPVIRPESEERSLFGEVPPVGDIESSLKSVDDVAPAMSYLIQSSPELFKALTVADTLDIIQIISEKIKESLSSDDLPEVGYKYLKGLMLSRGVPDKQRSSPDPRRTSKEFDVELEEAQRVIRERQKEEGVTPGLFPISSLRIK